MINEFTQTSSGLSASKKVPSRFLSVRRVKVIIVFLDNDAFNFASGYVNSDVNGDGFVDLNDLTIANNNVFNFVSKVTP